ncbi:tripartite motif-containing protein [Anaeramoeba flamelloides]|uniref:Tripartite motif-containing protein n=1 Tax=Anaeramoeba flamelloides TaxID=1746091 RepID=A0ABQ8YYH0_9EUKA|nr:tripartite motif-containing protein [Anaeramoeba flamelloides]
MNKSRSSQKKKQKSQDTKSLRDIRIPVEPKIPQCEICEEKKADFYCTKCEVHYCKACESELHTSSFLKKRHKEFISKEPYVSQEEIESKLCNKHNKELRLYCKEDNELICTKCYVTCRKNNHLILDLDEYSNEISEKIKIILNKIQNVEIQNNEIIQKSLELKNKFKIEIKELSNLIENQSNLLIQKIQKSKINHLNLLLKIGIISDTKFDNIMNKNEAKQESINETKKQIKILTKWKKDKKIIKLIRGSKEIFEKEEKEEMEKERKKEQQRKREIQREKEKLEEIRRLKQRKKEIEIQRSKEEFEEEFDPKMNRENIIKLKNENKTVWNPSTLKQYGRICGKKIYCRGKHQIKIKIDQFPNPENEKNQIRLGVIKTENMENLIENGEYEGTYYFKTWWDGKKKFESKKLKKENGKWTKEKSYPEEIYLKKNDIFEIFLDMDQKKISLKLNEKELGGWENLPKKVNFFAVLHSLEVEEKNQITFLKKSKKDKKTIKLIRESKEIIEKEEVAINETKKQIKILTKWKKDKKIIKLIRESKEIIEKEEIQRKKEIEIQRSKEEFDPKMNRENIIKLKNENKTVWNPSIWKLGKICGKKIYCRGKHQIKIKIDQFPNPENEENEIWLGVIKTENMENLIENGESEGTYCFKTYWDGKKKFESRKFKTENGKWTKVKKYPEEIYLKKNDIFEIFLDMDQKKISLKLNEKELGGWENLPEKINFFAYLMGLKVEEKNQITII